MLYDPEQDVYFISNINGGLLDKDDNGFITRVDANNLAVNLKWAEGGKGGVTLDGAKGMAIVGDTLYVSDVSAVRKFNRRTGAVEGEIALPGATTINDMTTDGNRVWVSDAAVVPASGGTVFASGTDLNQPNGLAFVNGELWGRSCPAGNSMDWSRFPMERSS